MRRLGSRFQTSFSAVLISDFDYDLPEELIAQQPAEPRDASRMLVVDRHRACWQDCAFRDLPELVHPGDVLVINNTRVFPARLIGRREPSGGKIELLLLTERGALEWEALARPARRLPVGARVSFGEGRLRGEIREEIEGGLRLVRFECEENFDQLLDEIGRTPLPPYIKRDPFKADAPDRERYQTIFARERGAVAAPTAGLHFTPRIIAELRERGAQIAEITLHVGYGTFEPVRVKDVQQHRVAAERFVIGQEAAEKIAQARRSGGRIIAVGTTSVRALESAADERGIVKPTAGSTQLTIVPGYRFRAVDALLTNFHLPRSSLLLLVSAFAGRELILAAYRHAVKERYRFYSYGDCMLII
ncbi:S-adenosylmethionine--tRNA ribosyltransferase-isomerase [Pyrinomonas methylaliphatogenes]|uniref:S-adenosylmethionine:tRNA ribosyltransferase-isomerase n=1 Tax=Pyrinomonas methylaliphatogenes TaxID=454194 RepID=A0A0B6WTV2_9BACT|nr:S-adenosylmethionine--tRNA ribosyltransferase-isomerase [Pyrinomonas methylaliphatogenes]